MCSTWQNQNFKEFEDKVLGAIILIVSMPLMTLVAVLIKLTTPGPVLYVQKRHGFNGKHIRVYKFRTMYGLRQTDRTRLTPLNRQAVAPHDPKDARTRITRLGKVLRATSIDELPQLFNVMKGEMSLVGPRPHPLSLNRRYAPVVEQLPWRHCVKPGMTGLAQINGARGPIHTAEDMRRRVQYDLDYICNWSPLLDVKILGLTLLKGFFNGNEGP